MKRSLPIPGETENLSTELEWMLEGGQASDASVARALTFEFGIPLNRLAALCSPPYPGLAEEALASATLRREQYSREIGPRAWVFAAALRALGGRAEPAIEQFFAHEMGLTAAELAYVYGEGEAAAVEHLARASETNVEFVNDKYQLEQGIDCEALALAVQRRVASSRRRRKISLRVMEMALGGLAVALVFLFGWLAGQFPNALPATTGVVKTVIVTRFVYVTPAPTPFTILSENSSVAEIVARMNESVDLWNTLWADALIVHYGPGGYIGQPLIYRNQVWLEKPNLALIIAGFENHPDYFRISAQGDDTEVEFGFVPAYYSQVAQNTTGFANLRVRTMRMNLATFLPFDTQTNVLPYGFYLYSMLFPAVADIGEMSLQLQGKEVVAGRETLRLGASSPEVGIGPMRLWVDNQTGVILRWQAYDPRQPETIVWDAQITAIALDTGFPVDFFRESYIFDMELDWDELWQPTPSPLTFDTFLVKERLATPPLRPAPAGFDPATAQLTFVWDAADDWMMVSVLGDGYQLGDARVNPSFWQHCSRSPDGRWLAISGALRVIDLADVAGNYYPLPNGTVPTGIAAFSPDSRTLAFWGCGGSEQNCGIYLHNLETRKNVKLILMQEWVESLTFSPDGSLLAIEVIEHATYGKPQTNLHMVVDTSSAKVVFQAPLESSGSVKGAPVGSPVWEWGVQYPPSLSLLEDCVSP